MKRIGVVFAVLSSLAVGAGFLLETLDDPARAEGGLVLQAPDDYCSVNEFYERDGEILAAIYEELDIERLTVLGLYADCAEIGEARTNRSSLRHYAIYTAQQWPNDNHIGLPRSKLIAGFAESMKRLYPTVDISESSDDAGEATARAMRESGSPFAFLDMNDRSVFVGALIKSENGGRGSVWLATVSATTILHGEIVALALIDTAEHIPSIPSLLARQRINMDRLFAANE